MVVKTESFEGMTATANSPYGLGDLAKFLMPGFQSVYQFSSGLQLLDPIPNNHEVALVADLVTKPGSTWTLADHGVVDTVGEIPSGSAYFGINDDLNGMVTFGFGGQKVYKVGAFVDSSGAFQNAISAFDASGKLIAGAAIRNVSVDDWDTNYIEVISNKPIAKVVFTGNYLILDDVTFDTDKPNIFKAKKEGSKVNGTNQDDVLLGKKGNDKLKGKAGDDNLDGKKGNDKLKGGDGNDLLSDDKGLNKMWGNEGQDSFLFKATHTLNIVKDFDPFDDTMLLAKSAFTVLQLGQLMSAQFHVGDAATTADHRILYDDTTGIVRYDADGTGTIAAVEVAKLSAGLAMTNLDFVVV